MIKKLTIDDYDKMYALWLSCKGMGLNDTDDSREGIRRFLDRNPDTCFGAFEADMLIGVIHGSWFRPLIRLAGMI